MVRKERKIKNMKKRKVIVCGVHFGKFYIESCNQNERLELTGILSNGSEESYELADKNNVPLYTRTEDITKDMADIIVIVTRTLITGGKSDLTVKSLLEKGISIIQEQPVHEKEVINICKSIRSDKQDYYINNFYRFLENTKNFIFYAKKIIRQYEVIRLQMSCSSQVLYPLIDILYEIFGDIYKFDLRKVEDGNMEILSGAINDVPFSLNYYNEYSEDNDGNLALFFYIKIESNAGNLILTDPEGAVIWQSHLCYEKNMCMQEQKIEELEPIEYLGGIKTVTYMNRYKVTWPQAMGKSIEEFFDKSINTGIEKFKTRTLRQCEIYSNITKIAGKPKKIKNTYLHGISLKQNYH